MNTRTFMAGIAVVVMVLLWGAVAYLSQTVEQEKIDYIDNLSETRQSYTTLTSAMRLRELMNDTKEQRAALTNSLPQDVVAVVDALDAVGKASGVHVQISNAQPQSVTGGRASGISAVAFGIQSEGTFAQLSRLIVLLNSLPMPVNIESVELTGGDASLWNVSARIHVLIVSATTK